MYKITALLVLVSLALVLLTAGLGAAAPTYDLTLVKDGQPAASIVLAPEPTRAAQLAAYELQYHLRLITGAEVPIVFDNGPIAGLRILVGDTPTTKQLGLEGAKLGEQTYVMQFRPNTLVLLGPDAPDTAHVMYDMDNPANCSGFPGIFDAQGTLYATYDFLERYCGVRWFNPTELGTVCPHQRTLTVSGESLQRKPHFRYRDAIGAEGENAATYDAYTALWQPGDPEYTAWDAASYAGLHQRVPAGSYETARGVLDRLFLFRMRDGGAPDTCNHSMYGYYGRFWDPNATPQLFVEKRPEYFAKGYEGQPPQMCYTDEGLIKQEAQDASDYYNGKKTGAQLGIFWNPTLPNPFPVEPMDNSSFCKCDACRALYEKSAAQTSPYFSTGMFSDYFFHFVNAVTKQLQTTNPGAPIITLAYASHAQHPSFQLDPHVIVEFCFATNRAPYDPAQYAHEESLLKDWAKDKRDLYLWLYDTFPVESARGGKYHAFPGFFAHTIGEQFNLFKQTGVKGMFHCGYGQEVEAYLTFKLMDNPDLKVDDLLDEYFTGLYGPAGAPMKTMYLEMEKVYSDPALRPKEGLSGASLSWGVLGTQERMARWQGLLDQAKALAQTDEQKARLVAFEHGTWSYMTAGREQYVTRASAPIPSVTVPAVPAAGGDVAKVNWNAAAAMPGPWFDRGGATPSQRSYSGRIAHDDKYLYLELTDQCDPKKLVMNGTIFPFDDWEVFVAKQRALPYRQYACGPTGLTVALSDGEVNWRDNVPVTDSGWSVVSDTTAPDRWVTRMVFPLATMLAGGVAPDGNLYMNVMRISSPAVNGTGALGLDTWVSYCTVHEVDRLGELKLGK